MPGRPCTITVAPLAPGEGRSYDDVIAANQGVLLYGSELGTRTLTATLLGEDPDLGPDHDTHVTNLSYDPPKNTSAVACPQPKAARASAGTCTLPARSLRALRGTASGDVARVELALVRLSGGARSAAARCDWLTATGRFSNTPLTRKRCATPSWHKASGKKRWQMRLRRPLKRGSYAVYSRAVSRAGAPQPRFSARRRNRLTLKLR